MAAGRMSRGWQPVCHPRADHRRPSRRGWRYDRWHPLRVAWLPSASPNVRLTLCAESAYGRALYHNVIELAVLPRVPIVDFVGLVKKKEVKKKRAGAGEDIVREIRRSEARSPFPPERITASSTFRRGEPSALSSGPIVFLL